MTIDSSSQTGHDVKVDPTALIGPNCHLSGDITVEAGAVLVGGVTLIGNVYIGRDARIEPGVCIATRRLDENSGQLRVRIGQKVHVGAGTVLHSGVSIGHNAWVEPGTVVLRDIPSHAIVRGNPATITGYKDGASQSGRGALSIVVPSGNPGVQKFQVQGVSLHQFPRIRDLRGDLTVGEFERNVPFQPKRYFIVYDVPSTETRGEHAHKKCHQFLVCVSGSVSIVVDDGLRREEVLMNQPNMGLLIPAGIWGIQYKYTPNSVLFVLASDYYDATDYIRNYDDFLVYRGVSA